jgi:hypothetical protein
MSGVELATASRTRPCPPRVIYMSVYPRPVDDGGLWLSKPLDVDALLRTVGSAAVAA